MSQTPFHEDYGNTRGFGLSLDAVLQGVIQEVTEKHHNVYILGDDPGLERFSDRSVDYSLSMVPGVTSLLELPKNRGADPFIS